MRANQFTLLPGVALAILLTLLVGSPVFGLDNDGHGQRCTVDTLEGLYVFSATGFVTPTTGPPLPKAIVELLRFHGDSTVTVPGGAVSLPATPTGGTHTSSIPAGETGTYTVTDLVPPDGLCTGTLTFPSGPSHDLFFPLNGERIWTIQTNPHMVLQGTATKVSH
jgi:hypothetical protein